jgi:MFS superfamily sulfate permease-like transporter
MPLVERAMPIFFWAKHYNRQIFRSDLLASMIVSILFKPVSSLF